MNQNLLRLIYSHKKCDLTDQQILSILLGMGIVEDVAISHLEYYNKMNKGDKLNMDSDELKLNRNMEVTEPVKNPADKNILDNINENYMKKFTALQLYENILQTSENLKEYSKNNAQASYSAMTANSILEQAINAFPSRINLIASRKANGLPCDESTISPSLKYEIAESVYNSLKNDWLPDVKTLCSYIAETMNTDKWGYVTTQALKKCNGKLSNNMYASLYEQLTNALGSENIYESVKEIAFSQEYWSNECRQIVALIESEEYNNNKKLNKTVVENNNCTMVKLFSPILENENGITFNLWGKNYTICEGKLMETNVADERYNNVVNGLSKLSYNQNDNCLEYYGANGKVLEYDLTNEKLHIGDKDLTEMGSLDLRDYLNVSGLFSRQNVGDVDTLVKFFESKDMLSCLDNCINLKSEEVAGLYLTLLAVEEGVYVNKINFRNMVNEMKYFKSANEARTYIKENINYDATFVLKEKLQKENDELAKLVEKRTEIKERIDFLKEKRNMVAAKIETLPTNVDRTKLLEALNLLECELRKNEDELATTFTNNLGDDYVPVKVCNVVGTLNIGDVVYVKATEFTSQPECTTITVVDPKTNQQVVVAKNDLLFDINHNHQEVSTEDPNIPIVPEEPAVEPIVEPATEPVEPTVEPAVEPETPKVCPTCGVEIINDKCKCNECGNKDLTEEE